VRDFLDAIDPYLPAIIGFFGAVLGAVASLRIAIHEVFVIALVVMTWVFPLADGYPSASIDIRQNQ